MFGGSLLATGLSDDRHGLCAGPCATGENWECVGRFKWDALPQQGSLWVEVQIVDSSIVTAIGPAEPLAGLPGIEIGPCGLGETLGDGGCQQFWPANGYGALTIEFDPRIHAAIGVKSPYGHYRAYARPLMRDSRVRFFVPQRNFNLSVLVPAAEAKGDPLDLIGRGIVAFRQWDCLAMPSIGVSHTIASAGSLHYWSPPSEPDFHRPAGENGGFTNVPPTMQVEVSSTDESGMQVSRRAVRVDAGWYTYVDLYPRDANGL